MYSDFGHIQFLPSGILLNSPPSMGGVRGGWMRSRRVAGESYKRSVYIYKFSSLWIILDHREGVRYKRE
jgi:hypothetical protein